MKKIQLTQGMSTMVDDRDYDYLNQFKWSINKTSPDRFKSKKIYVVRNEYIKGRKSPKKIYMHRVILDLKDRKECVDHINGDTLDNRRKNLKKCTHRENGANLYNKSEKSSKYTGVSLYTQKNGTKFWRSQYKYKGKIYVKLFEYTSVGEKQAAKWYKDNIKGK